MKAWSISTTIRNPERIPDFVKVAQRIEGRPWDNQTQEDFYAWAIAMRVVTPENANLSVNSIGLIEGVDEEIPFDKARKIFDEKKYEDPPMRGRQQMAPLSANGLVSTEGNVVHVTELGKLITEDKVAFSELMLNFAFKFQVPQPEHRKYTIENGYCIKPFTGSLALIDAVNKMWQEKGHNSVGLKWEEFCTFVPTLINFRDIQKQAELIVNIREKVAKGKDQLDRESIWKSHITTYLSKILDTRETMDYGKLTDTLRDYGDNTYRYFSQSQFFRLRGGGNYVDISEISAAQVNLLIENREFEPLHMASKSEYEKYIGDLTSFTPPWAVPKFAKVVKQQLEGMLQEQGIDISHVAKQKTVYTVPSMLREDPELVALRNALKGANVRRLISESMTPEFLEACAIDYERLANRLDVVGGAERRLNRPAQLEWITYKALLAINDLVEIKPNYPTDDEGYPIFTAGAGVPDLEIYYSDFNVVCEVTMLTNRDQWVAEGQPVQRHLFEFAKKHTDKEAIGIFIAPVLHRDTRNTFKQAFYGGYDEVDSLKIIPFEFKNWTSVVRQLAGIKSEGRSISQSGFKNYLESMLPSTGKIENTDDWWNRISSKNNILEYVA